MKMKFQVTRCENMPIIDENDQSLDKNLMNQVSINFFQSVDLFQIFTAGHGYFGERTK